MIDSCTRLILNLEETGTPVTVKAKRGDTGRVLRIRLTDGDRPYPIGEDCSGVFTGKKPDNTVIYNRCSVENGEIVYAFTEQTCTVAGQIPAEIRLYGSGGKLLTSASFILDVEDTVFGEDDVISQGEMNVLDALVTETKALKQEIEEKLASGAFRGEPGPPGVDGTVAFDALTEEQKASLKGADGTVSFEELTEQQRLSLKGEPGEHGKPGEAGEPGQPGKAGDPGKSAYAYAAEGGFSGTEAEFAHKLAEDALLTAGGTMKGSVSMGGNPLTGLPAPQAEDHAASKAYVDEVAASHTENAENPHGVTAQQVGARPDDWMPTAAQVGAATPEAVKEAVRKAAPRNLMGNSNLRNPVNQRKSCYIKAGVPLYSDAGLTAFVSNSTVARGAYYVNDTYGYTYSASDSSVKYYVKKSDMIPGCVTRYARPFDRWQFDNGGAAGHSCSYDSENRYTKLDASETTGGFAALYHAIDAANIEPGDYTVVFHALDYSAGQKCQLLVQGDGSTIKHDGNLIPDEHDGLIYMNFTVPNNLSGTLFFAVYALPGRYLCLDWGACYKGTYTAETMPEYQPKEYGVELAECQRYFRRWEGYDKVGIAVPYNATTAVGCCFIPEMRVKPSVKFEGMTLSSDSYPITGITVSSSSNNMVELALVSSATLTVGNLMTIRASASGYMELSADL